MPVLWNYFQYYILGIFTRTSTLEIFLGTTSTLETFPGTTKTLEIFECTLRFRSKFKYATSDFTSISKSSPFQKLLDLEMPVNCN